MMLWGAISNRRRSQHIHIRQKHPEEYRYPNDMGGMESEQYCKKVLRPGFLPLWKKSGGAAEEFSFVQNGSKIHISAYNYQFKLGNGIICSDWSNYTPDLNPIENVLPNFKLQLKISFRTSQHRHRGIAGLVRAELEERNIILQEKLDNFIESMPILVLPEIGRHRGYSGWWYLIYSSLFNISYFGPE